MPLERLEQELPGVKNHLEKLRRDEAARKWEKPQLFICQNPRNLMARRKPISKFAASMERSPEIFGRKGERSFHCGIVHLYQQDEHWKPTAGTEGTMENYGRGGSERAGWWGFYVDSKRAPSS